MQVFWRDVFNGKISHGKDVIQETKSGVLASARAIQPSRWMKAWHDHDDAVSYNFILKT